MPVPKLDFSEAAVLFLSSRFMFGSYTRPRREAVSTKKKKE
jgi:hypothetical protein